MHALQSIDESLFRFINLKLVNPVFDVLMPFLSGNQFFIPAIVVTAVLVLWRGGCKGRVYAVMIAILLSIGDPCICNPLKHFFARPRPFVTLPDARRRGKDSYEMVSESESANKAAAANPNRARNSMPSAHAFNWGAFVMITFIYYRRSWRFLLPIGLAVAFSRVYNGVHYPGDVMAGLLLGAAYGLSGVICISALWAAIGKKFFPAWQRRLPNLALPKLEPAKAAVARAHE
jgi:membrane-associated phospholipid phosphatase